MAYGFDNRSVDAKELADGQDIKFEGFKKNFSNVSASAGLSYEASGNVILKLNLARGFSCSGYTRTRKQWCTRRHQPLRIW
ncbi:MAG: hypothetical protein WDO16_06205 [Bacteroidota bacterium]